MIRNNDVLSYVSAVAGNRASFFPSVLAIWMGVSHLTKMFFAVNVPFLPTANVIANVALMVLGFLSIASASSASLWWRRIPLMLLSACFIYVAHTVIGRDMTGGGTLFLAGIVTLMDVSFYMGGRNLIVEDAVIDMLRGGIGEEAADG